MANPKAEERSVRGADAAAGVTRPQESQIRGSFMPGGGTGEDATTEVDADTGAQFAASASDEEKESSIKKAREDAQRQYEQSLNDPDSMTLVPRGVDTTNPNPTAG